MKTKDLTDKQIQEQINELEEENANTQRLSFRRGHGWGDGVLEKRRDKIQHLQSILAMRRFDKRKATPKKQGLSRTWNTKTKQWVYHYTKRTKKAKKQPDTKLSPHDEWLLTGEYKVRNKPKDVRKLGKAVTKGLKKTKKVTKKGAQRLLRPLAIPIVKSKFFDEEATVSLKRICEDAFYRERELEEKRTQKPKTKKKKRTKAKPRQRTLFGGL